MGNMISQFFNPGAAYGKAGEEATNYYNQGQQYRQPYMQKGEQAGGDLQSMLAKLMNPGQLQNEWSQEYEQSPYAKQLQSENLGQGMDTASAMGLGGSSAALGNIQKGAGDITQKDRQQYMNDMMQKYMAAMGIGQNLYGTGASMAGQAGQSAQQMGNEMAGLKYGQESAGGNRLGEIGSMLGKLFMSGAGGGLGALATGGLGSSMFGGG